MLARMPWCCIGYDMTRRQQGLKKQLKKLKAAYEATSTTRKLSQHEHPRTMSWEASPLQAGTPASMARGRGPVVADSGGGGGAINPPAGMASLGGASGGRPSSWKLTSSYSLVVGEDVDELEEKFKATLDSEVRRVGHPCCCKRTRTGGVISSCFVWTCFCCACSC